MICSPSSTASWRARRGISMLAAQAGEPPRIGRPQSRRWRPAWLIQRICRQIPHKPSIPVDTPCCVSTKKPMIPHFSMPLYGHSEKQCSAHLPKPRSNTKWLATSLGPSECAMAGSNARRIGRKLQQYIDRNPEMLLMNRRKADSEQLGSGVSWRRPVRDGQRWQKRVSSQSSLPGSSQGTRLW